MGLPDPAETEAKASSFFAADLHGEPPKTEKKVEPPTIEFGPLTAPDLPRKRKPPQELLKRVKGTIWNSAPSRGESIDAPGAASPQEARLQQIVQNSSSWVPP